MAIAPRVSSDSRFPDRRTEELAELIEPTVTEHGLFLEELRLKPSGETTQLRVVVDYFSGTDRVDLDTLAELSQALDVVLDAHAESGPLGSLETYELEVSTPGATRPLTEARHYRRNLERLLEITLAEGEEMVARLVGVEEDSLTVTEVKPPAKKGMKPKIGPETTLPLADVTRARVQVEFSQTDQD